MSVALRPSLRVYVDEEAIFDMSIKRTIRQSEQRYRLVPKKYGYPETSGVHAETRMIERNLVGCARRDTQSTSRTSSGQELLT